MAFLAPVAGFLVETAFALGAPISIGTAMIGSAAILGFGAKAVYDYVIDGMMDDLSVDTMSNRTQTTKDPIPPRRLVYGTIRTGGQIVYQANSGNNNKYLHNFIVFSVGQISRIHEIYFDNELAMRLTPDNQIRYYGRYSTNSDGSPSVDGRSVYIIMKAGTDTQSSLSGLLTEPPPDWTANHKLSGLAYVYVQLTFDEDTHVNGFPNITAVVRGKKHYNPKHDDTVSGGSGSQRLSDKSTWEYSNNPAVCLLNYMLDEKIGLNESIDSFHMPTLLDSIDTCDTTFDDTEVTTTNELFVVGDRYKIVTPGTSVDWASIGVSGTPEVGQIFTALDDGASLFGNELYMGSARKVYNNYACDGIIDSRNSHKANIQNILSSMNGQLVYSNGKFRIMAYDTKSPVQASVNEKKILGNFDVITKQSRRNMYNRVKGKYMSSENNYAMTEYPVQKFVDSTTSEATFEIDDGEVLYYEQSLPMTTRHVNAQRLARLTLLRSRMQSTIKFTGNSTCLAYTVGDRINVSNETLGYSEKVYQISNLSVRIDTKNGLVVDIEAKEDAPSIYDWSMSDAEDFTTGSLLQLYNGKPEAPTFINAVAAHTGFYVGWLHPEYRSSVTFVLTVSAEDPNLDDTQTYTTSGNTIFIDHHDDIRKYKLYKFSVQAVDTATGVASDSISITNRRVSLQNTNPYIVTGTDAIPTDEYVLDALEEDGVDMSAKTTNVTYLQLDSDGFVIDSLPLTYVNSDLYVVTPTYNQQTGRSTLTEYDLLNGVGAMDTDAHQSAFEIISPTGAISFTSDGKLEFNNATDADSVTVYTDVDRPPTDGRAYAIKYDEDYGANGAQNYDLKIYGTRSSADYERGEIDGTSPFYPDSVYYRLGTVARDPRYKIKITGHANGTNTKFDNLKLLESVFTVVDERRVAQNFSDKVSNLTFSHEILSTDIPYASIETENTTQYGDPVVLYKYLDSASNEIGRLTIRDRYSPDTAYYVQGKHVKYMFVRLTKIWEDDIPALQIPGKHTADVKISASWTELIDVDGVSQSVSMSDEIILNLYCELFE